jgi:hypothetical protein
MSRLPPLWTKTGLGRAVIGTDGSLEPGGLAEKVADAIPKCSGGGVMDTLGHLSLLKEAGTESGGSTISECNNTNCQ